MVAASTAEGAVLHVGRAGGAVTIADGSTPRNGHVISIEETRKLVGLLDEALKPDCRVRGLLGGVALTNGRELFVKRWPSAVSVAKTRDGHSGWALVLVDQVRELRDALDKATSDARAA